jgi:hypothetical protein
VILLPLSIPFGLVGLGETPGQCWSPEPMAAVKSERGAAAAHRRPQSVCARAAAFFGDFLSAIKHPPFKWLFSECLPLRA